MTTGSMKLHARRWDLVFFAVIQVAVMLLAISNESLWIDEFWAAYYAKAGSLHELYKLLLIPSGSQTPLHFIYTYFWGLFVQPSELGLRMANLPLFVIGQLSLFLALRAYPKKFSYLFLAVSALHPMVWQYANEARPYIMMYAGSEMILAYMLYINMEKDNVGSISPLFSMIFVFGSILLFGASLLGVFWVFAACVYVVYFHYRYLDWHYLTRGATLLLLGVFLAATSLLTLYYLNSLIQGGGASRLASTTVATLMFDAYELLGLSGVGPGRLELRDSGLAALHQYWVWLLPSALVILITMIKGLQEALRLLGTRRLIVVAMLSLLPLAIVVFSGFALHWRVLGRHMIAALPVLNLLFALGLARLFEKDAGSSWPLRVTIAMVFLLVLTYSSFSMRFADRHKKDDYSDAAAIAQQSLAKGKRVWWAADALGANYYGLPGEFDYMGEITGKSKPSECIDRPGVQSVIGDSKDCLNMLSSPGMVILSKPETYDKNGAVVGYLKANNFVKIRTLPAFTVWQPSGQSGNGNK